MDLTVEQLDYLLGEDLAQECEGLPIEIKGMLLTHLVQDLPEEERVPYVRAELKEAGMLDA